MARLSREDKIPPEDVYEGDRVAMKINPHNLDASGSVLVGEVVEAPSESDREYIGSGEIIMANYTVENDSGTRWTWNVDNGYVIGPVDHPDRPSRSDIGRFRGFYDPDAVDKSRLREIGALAD